MLLPLGSCREAYDADRRAALMVVKFPAGRRLEAPPAGAYRSGGSLPEERLLSGQILIFVVVMTASREAHAARGIRGKW